MKALFLIALVWAIYKLISSASARSVEEEKMQTWERIAEEQRRIRTEQNRAVEWQREQERRNREELQKRVAMEKAIAKAKKEREALRKEQEKQAAAIKKHDEEIIKLKQIVYQSKADIAFLEARFGKLCDQRDYLIYLRNNLDTTRRDYDTEYSKYQKKIITLENQMHTTDSKLTKARFAKEQAQRKLA